MSTTREKLRSDCYKFLNVLCHLNSHKQAGWLVCKYVLTDGCKKLSAAVLVYNTQSGGTGRLARHIEQHNGPKPNVIVVPQWLDQASKEPIAPGAALAVALDINPLSFTDHKERLVHFVDAIFRAGQDNTANNRFDPKSVMPCTKTVSAALSTLAKENREVYKGMLPSLIKTGGGVTTDGVTLKVQDKQFYDLTIHFITAPATSVFDPTPKFEMNCKTLLLQEKKGEGSAELIRSLLGNALQGYYNCDMDALTKGFTMVTDNASVMARVAGASVSERLAPLNEKWMGCIVHQINTATKCCISETSNEDEVMQIHDDVQAVKKIVRIFKQSNWNSLLPNGQKLIQEVETRFGTTFLVVQRFLKSANLVQQIVDSKDSASAKSAFQSLIKSTSASGAVTYPALEAVIDAFKPVTEIQTKLEASHVPTLHVVLLELQICLDKLQTIADGGSVLRSGDQGFVPASRLFRKLSRSTVEWLEAKVRIHPLIMAGCYLNPLFRELQFLDDLNKRRTYRNGGEAMVRSLIASILVDGQQDTDTIDATQSMPVVGGNEADNQPPVAGRKRTYSLLDYADSHFQPLTSQDEVSRYNCMDIGQMPIDSAKYVRDAFAPVRFWYMHRSTFPNLYKLRYVYMLSLYLLVPARGSSRLSSVLSLAIVLV